MKMIIVKTIKMVHMIINSRRNNVSYYRHRTFQTNTIYIKKSTYSKK